VTAKPSTPRAPDAKPDRDLVEGRVEYRSPKSLRGHREAARIPSMSVDEAAAFEADIAENGIQLPLDITAAGVVLDGRHRHRAALALGLDSVPVRVVEPADEVEYMFRMALVRRHLSAGQKALVVLERDEYRTSRAAAAERKRANLRNGPLDVATLPHRGRTRALAAERAGVSERTVQHAITVREHGDPDLLKQVAAGKLSVEKAAREVKRRERYARIGESPPLPDGLFDLIYADPPWQLGNPDSDHAPEQHYPTMPLEEIAALDIPAADNCLLYLWVANPVLPAGLQVLEAWGFEYRGNEVWDKKRIGLGVWTRYQHELLLIGRKGNASPAQPELLCPSLFSAERTRHSEKPPIVYERLEQLYPERNKLELFARTKRPGWTPWGNEVPA
jgi:N6-adenosine-specific RNA methylase IME4